MSYGFCNYPEDHKKEGREDFDRHGRYGYDPFKYNDPFDDCNGAYTDGFDNARREDDRRRERQEEERIQEQRYERRQYEQRQFEREMEEQEYEMWENEQHLSEVDEYNAQMLADYEKSCEEIMMTKEQKPEPSVATMLPKEQEDNNQK